MSESFSSGDIIASRYEVKRSVGAGAGGQIYLAGDLHLGGRPIAIKIYEPDALIQDLAEHVRKGTISREVYEAELSNIYNRFRQEAVRIAQLDHPGIVKVYDYQDQEYEVILGGRETVSPRPFLCMEFVEGETLEEALSKQKIRMRDALLIGAQLADGLAYAHAKKLVHRDLKPSNIMVEDSPGGLRIRIIDWGVAKAIAGEAKVNMTRIMAVNEPEEEEGEEGIRTRGILLGTPKFIAPEHFESGGASWSPASDVFAMGMVLFRMVTKRPLRRESYVGECLTQPDRDLLQEAARGMGDLADVIMLCLSEIREERLTGDVVRDRLTKIHAKMTETSVIPPAAPPPIPPPSEIGETEKTPISAPEFLHEHRDIHETAPPSFEAASPSLQDEPQVAPARGVGWSVVFVMLVVGVALGFSGMYLLQDARGTSEVTAPNPEKQTVSSGNADSDDDSASGASAEPPAPTDPDAIDVTVTIKGVAPGSKAGETVTIPMELLDEEDKVLGPLPYKMRLRHRYAVRKLTIRPVKVEKPKVYGPRILTVSAFQALGDQVEGRESVVIGRLHCVDFSGKRCMLSNFSDENAFESGVGER